VNRDQRRQEWREIDSASRSAGWRIALWTVLAVLFVGAIGGGIWYFKVATSDVKGTGDATRQINSGQNRIASQEAFEALYAQIQAYDRNLDQAAKDKAEHPGDSFYTTNYSGLVKQCNDAVGQYNADARKVSRAKWLTDDLPFEIDLNNPATDCKEPIK
jgi:nitrate reductase NapE component